YGNQRTSGLRVGLGGDARGFRGGGQSTRRLSQGQRTTSVRERGARVLRDVGHERGGDPEGGARLVLGEAQEVLPAQQPQGGRLGADGRHLATSDREERETSHHLARADRERFGAAPAAQLEATLEHEQQRVGVVAFVEQRLPRGEIAVLEERG